MCKMFTHVHYIKITLSNVTVHEAFSQPSILLSFTNSKSFTVLASGEHKGESSMPSRNKELNKVGILLSRHQETPTIIASKSYQLINGSNLNRLSAV